MQVKCSTAIIIIFLLRLVSWWLSASRSVPQLCSLTYGAKNGRRCSFLFRWVTDDHCDNNLSGFISTTVPVMCLCLCFCPAGHSALSPHGWSFSNDISVLANSLTLLSHEQERYVILFTAGNKWKCRVILVIFQPANI